MDYEGYYAEAFYPEPGQCFRMIMAGTHGSPALCPSPSSSEDASKTAEGSGTTCGHASTMPAI
jgi:hypothetical protein